MKRLISALTLVLAAVTVPAMAADIGLSVRVGEPGFYGRIDIGNAPPPQVIYAQPVVIHPVPVELEREPIYMRVPREHEKHWGRYCREYNACGQRVYFVQDRWYRDEYVPHYREHQDRGREEEYRDDRREEHERDRGRDDERGHSRGHRND